MREQIEAAALEGQTVRVKARETLRVEPKMLALAAALRVFERYAVLDRLTLTAGAVEVVVSREDVHRLLGPEGFAVLNDPARYRQIVSHGLASEREEGTG